MTRIVYRANNEGVLPLTDRMREGGDGGQKDISREYESLSSLSPDVGA